MSEHDATVDDGHLLLIVEDDENIANIVKELVTSLGYRWRYGATLAEMRAAITEGGLCGAILDMQIPALRGAKPLVSSGETALTLLRKRQPAINEQGRHAFPILVLTGSSTDPDVVSEMFELGADAVIAKPFDADMDKVLNKIRRCMQRAGREDHEQCSGLAGPAAPRARSRRATVATVEPSARPPRVKKGALEPASPRGVHIVIGAARIGSPKTVLVNDEPRELQPKRFVVLLRLGLERELLPGTWADRFKLRVHKSADVIPRIGEALEVSVPKGFKVVETKRNVGCRLNPAVTLDIDWRELAKHEDPDVKQIVDERYKRRRAGGST